MSSSGYDWKADTDILLDTAVIGAPGSVLPLPLPGEPGLPASSVAHRQALARWFRHTTSWEPLWLNSEIGAAGREPITRCFGRVERINGNGRVTAVALRSQKPQGSDAAPLRGMRWEGRWALIAQDDESIFASRKLACIPFDAGVIEVPLESRPTRVLAVRAGDEVEATGWTYADGKLRLAVPPGSESLLGFVVMRGQE